MPSERRLSDTCHSIDCIDVHHSALGGLLGNLSAQLGHRPIPPGEMGDLAGQSPA
jgi:hypothetical protein